MRIRFSPKVRTAYCVLRTAYYCGAQPAVVRSTSYACLPAKFFLNNNNNKGASSYLKLKIKNVGGASGASGASSYF